MVKGLEGLGSLEGLEGLAKVWKVDGSVKEERLLSLNTERPAYPPAEQPEGAARRGALNAEMTEFERHGVFLTGFTGFDRPAPSPSILSILSILSKTPTPSPCLPPSVSSVLNAVGSSMDVADTPPQFVPIREDSWLHSPPPFSFPVCANGVQIFCADENHLLRGICYTICQLDRVRIFDDAHNKGEIRPKPFAADAAEGRLCARTQS